MRFILIILLLFFGIMANGQEKVVLTVLDQISLTPIQNVNVSSENGYFLGKTNTDGAIILELYSTKIISLNHVSYSSKEVEITFGPNSYTIQLMPKTEVLGDVTITAKEPVVVYKNDVFHASDYEFLDQNNILILTYEKKRMFKKESQADLEILERCKLVCLDENLKVKTESKIIPVAIDIQKDEFGQCFLTTIESIFFVIITDHGIMLDEMSDDFSLNENRNLVIDETNEIQLISDYEDTYPEFSYYLSNRKGDLEKVCTVKDEQLMHLFRAQYRDFKPREKLEAYRMELKTGIDKEVISGYMSGFHKSIYFRPIYAPAFKVDSGFIIVNHVANQIERYSSKGVKIDGTEIKYHLKSRKTGWTENLIQDKETEEIYTCFEVNGNAILKKINHRTGQIHDEMKLTYRYPEQLSVLNGEVYYLYRPFGSSQKKYLYKEGSLDAELLAN